LVSDPKVVFLSYSHDSPEHRRRVLQLSQRLRADGLDTRLDQYVNGTPDEGWPRWMLDRLDEADWVVVICTETYYRRFRGHELPGKGKGVDWEGALITQEIYNERSRTKKFVPVLFDSDAGAFIPEPLRPHTYYVLTSETGYEGLYDELMEQAGAKPAFLGPPKVKERRTEEPLDFAGNASARIAPTRLPQTTDQVFGRETELAALDSAWADPKIHLLTLVAWGGVGKTSLVAQWAAGLAARDYDGASYFDWSFYSQGTRETAAATGETFIAAALRFFGGPEGESLAESARSAEEKGGQLARFVAQRRALLILDGLEPLQYPPGPLAGGLKDPGIAALLRGLAQSNPGLCVVTTRESVKDLESFRSSTAPEWELERLGTAAGVALLEKLQVKGRRAELEQLVEEVEGHALTLSVLGAYLRDAHEGDVRRLDLVELEEADREERNGHAFRAIATYEKWLGGEKEAGARQLALLRLLGLFDRPADKGCLSALRKEPGIPGLTEPLLKLTEAQWNLNISRLIACGLVSRSVTSPGGLDAHPLIREYFGRQLREHCPAAWRAAHGRLFEHLRDSTEKFPNTLEGLQSLYQAVAHGCYAGRHQEACDEIYRDRIQRGGEAFSSRKLGAIGADLGAVACFFDPPWHRTSPDLTEAAQTWLLNEAAYRLLALGRLTEALEPMRTGIEGAARLEDWKNAAIYSTNLSELELTLGDIPSAIRDAEQSMTFADRSGDGFRRVVERTVKADALHQAGRRADALALLREAERMQAERQPGYPWLYSLPGFRYCDLLLAGAERAAGREGGAVADVAALSKAIREVEERAAQTLRWVTNAGVDILSIALDQLSLGRAALYGAILEGSNLAPARAEIESALEGLRHAGRQDHIPKGLLNRAWLLFREGHSAVARADLAEAQEIAERGPMPLLLADIALYRGRLFGDREALAEARRLIEKHGYGRRLEELADAEAALPP
jgi:tetratricopeptide (TPR) repeat protein